eukprot:4564373-Pyramimonas_sp.AAC.1
MAFISSTSSGTTSSGTSTSYSRKPARAAATIYIVTAHRIRARGQNSAVFLVGPRGCLVGVDVCGSQHLLPETVVQ